MNKSFILILALILAAGGPCLFGQDSGASLLALARKRAQEATGKKGPELEGVLKDALKLYGAVVERFPEDTSSATRATLEMGRAHRRLGRAGDAEACFKKVVARPEEAALVCDALNDLATLYRREKKRDEAIGALQQIVEKYPGQPQDRAHALVRLAGLFRDAKDFAKAEGMLLQCLKEHADLWRIAIDAIDDLVMLKIRAKDPDAARRVLEKESEALRARHAGSSVEERVDAAIEKLPCRVRLDGLRPAEKPKPGDETEGGGF